MPTSRITVLEQEIHDLSAEETQILAVADAAQKAGKTPDSKAMERLGAIQARIPAAEGALDELKAERELRRGEPSLGDGTGIGDGLGSLAAGVGRRIIGAGDRSYAAMFGQPAASAWPDVNEYLKTVHSGLADHRIQAAAGSMSGKTGSDGGFLIPEQYGALLMDSSLEDEIVRPRAQVFPMTTDTRKVPSFDMSDRTGGAIAGLTPVWLEELATSTDQKAKTELQIMTAHKLGLFAQASNELVADGTDFETQLFRAMTLGMTYGLDLAFLNGNGVAKPRGILQDPALITVSKETGQVADTILYENLTKMFARLAPACLRRSIWLANTTTIPQLLTLTIPIGTGGQLVPVLREGPDGYSVLTRPIVFTEKLPVIGDLGDIVLTDLSQYGVGLRKEISIDRSNGPGWHEDATDYRTIVRVDGQGTWKGPLQPVNGSTLSWVVTLQAR